MESFEGVVVAPFTELLERPAGRSEHRGGPAWPDFAHQVAARHWRGSRRFDVEPEVAVPTDRLAGRHAWAGPIVNHFGHQVAEFSMRIVPTLARWPEASFLFAAHPRAGLRRMEDVPAFVRGILEWFGVPLSATRLITTPTMIDELVVCRQAEVMDGSLPDASHLDRMDELALRRLGRPRRHGVVY